VPKGGSGKTKAIDPFYKGPKKHPRAVDEATVNDPPRVNHRIEQRRERAQKLRALHAEMAKRRAERDNATETAASATESKLKSMTRAERKQAHRAGQAVVKVKRADTRLKMEPVVTTAMGNALDGFQSLFAPVAAGGDAMQAEINAMVKQQTRQLTSEIDFAKQVQISDALSRAHRDKAEIEKLAQPVENPHELLLSAAPKAKFVDADELTRTLMAQVQFERARGEKFFAYEARLNEEATKVRAAKVHKKTGERKMSSAKKWAERNKKRELEREERKQQRLLDQDDARDYYDVPKFGDVVEAPPQLPKLPERLLKRKAPSATPFAKPTEKQIAAAQREGVPLIESVAGGREATRAAITGATRSKALVGASSLSVEAYAELVREQYRAVKRRRREQAAATMSTTSTKQER
jgi:hypothetical protein